ncbi:MAG: aminotransferase class V-fold PLP-dependent enzyme, partial [Bacteroidetes bacterium]|nr:aminotransferase class V-fold PLP-dependent enzyme [Bacteroidota bacterium]
MQSELIYLDYNASTPVLPEVLETMLPYFSERFANPASHSHESGRMVAEAVEIAREQVASLLGASAQEIIFTSGATESLNLAIQGLWRVFKQHRRKFLVLCTEHHAVLDVLKYLESEGAQVELIPVDQDGRIDVEHYQSMLGNDVLAVCAMAANNETGRIYPVAELSALAHEFGAYFICDAT